MVQEPLPIHVLDKETAELIAAGEVVERPASIVKELLENAVDSGADAVSLEIKNGGVTFIRVTDNGCGIRREDVPTAFLRHATSKIARKDDLQSILTFGFRGEALAAVSAVSKVELLTRAKGELSGTRYRIEGGAPLCCEDAGCPQGTSITVRDLFYNTPARMKFLKRDSAETSAVSGVVERMAISNPQIAVKYMVNGAVRLHTPGDGKAVSAIHMVFGKEFSGALLPVEQQSGGIGVSGFVIRPEAARTNRSMQYFFVNGRYVRSKVCSAALDEGYQGSVMTGRFAACVLNVQVDPARVDVNVHPAKIEVKFSEDKAVYDAVYFAVRSALHKNDLSPQLQMKGSDFRHQTSFDYRAAGTGSVRPEGGVREGQLRISAQDYRAMAQGGERRAVDQSPLEKFPQRAESSFPKPGWVSTPPSREDQSPLLRDGSFDTSYNSAPVEPLLDLLPAAKVHAPAETPPLPESEPFAPEPIPSESPTPEPPASEPPVQSPQKKGRFEDARIVGELFETYLVLEQGERVLLVDKHAAHERLLYERFKAEADRNSRQVLLAPVSVTLSSEEYGALLQNRDALTQAGFLIAEFGFNTVLVREAPMTAADFSLPELVADLAQQLLRSRRQLLPEKIDGLLHSVACRCAIKAHSSTSKAEFEEILRLLDEHEDVKFCPHGRPIAVTLTRREIEKQFGRIT